MNRAPIFLSALACGAFLHGLTAAELPYKPQADERIALIGSGLGDRMQYFPHFETELQRHFPNEGVVVRNLCYAGDTPGFRPNPARTSQWAFPGAEKFHPDLKTHLGEGHFPDPDSWLKTVGADTVVAFFGYNESFDGLGRVDNFYAELDAFISHTFAQKYNGESAPRLVLVSPIAFEDLSAYQDLPNGVAENERLKAYSDAMRRVAKDRGVGFIDLFTPTLELYKNAKASLTLNGFAPTDGGYRQISELLLKGLYGSQPIRSKASREAIYQAVEDRNWFWLNDYRILNGVHVYGRRYKPYGNENYPEEIEKIRQMTDLRDKRIHDVARGAVIELAVDDSSTRSLTPINTNFDQPIEFLNVEKALQHFTLPDGYKIDLFASESEFPDLRNPVQMSFDNKGRMWVAVAPSYPHYRPGEERPNDKLLIFEDTDGDGRADKQTVFADGLHVPIGFELAAEGVYLAQQPNLVLLVDEDGDDRADRQELLLHGFDSHDTHHSISAFCADPAGAIYMNEGRFLHSQVETPYGPERCTDGGVWRFDPKTWRVERNMQTDLSNPWGIAYDDWGQMFLSDASGGANWWSLPLSSKVPHGYEIGKYKQFTTHQVRPTSGSEFVSSRHFPDEVQGDFLLNNTIGFLGTKQHIVVEDGAGFTGELRHDLVYSDDPNFRPCELEFAPDGSLYILDWHNPLIGHMQHSARDPNRDNDHGRIYRVTYPSRPLVEPPEIAGAPIEALLENLKLPEYRARYRTRRELRGHPASEVLPAVRRWADGLDRSSPDYDRNFLEALWATWAQNQVDVDLLKQGLSSKNHKVRAASVHVLRYAYRNIPDSEALFLAAVNDENPRVRLEAVVAASWLDNEAGAAIALAGLGSEVTEWMVEPYIGAMLTLGDDVKRLDRDRLSMLASNGPAQSYLKGKYKFAKPEIEGRGRNKPTNMSKELMSQFEVGKEIYMRDGYCMTCHGENGEGAIAGVYPPLNDNPWLNGNDDRLIKLVLKGLWGPMEVDGKHYDPTKGVPPMTAFEGMLDDEQVAAVLTFVKVRSILNTKNVRKGVTAEQVAKVRAEIKGKVGFYSPEELLKQHPIEE